MAIHTHRYQRSATRALPDLGEQIWIYGMLHRTPRLVLLIGHYADNDTYVYTSDDEGQTWTLRYTLTAGYAPVSEVVWTGTHYMFAAKNGTALRAFRSTDGVSWTDVSVATTSQAVRIMTDGNGTVVLVPHTGSTGWRSTDHAASWGNITLPTGTAARYTDGCWNGTTFCFSDEEAGAQYAVKSTTGASGSWTRTALSGRRYFFADGSTMYAISPFGGTVLKSTDNGATWPSASFTTSGLEHHIVENGRLVSYPTTGVDSPTFRHFAVDLQRRMVVLLMTDEVVSGPAAAHTQDGSKLFVIENTAATPFGKFHVVNWETIPDVELVAGVPQVIAGESYFHVATPNATAVTGEVTSGSEFAAVTAYFAMPDHGDIFDAFGYADMAGGPFTVTVSDTPLGDVTYGYIEYYVSGQEEITLVMTYDGFWTGFVKSEAVSS